MDDFLAKPIQAIDLWAAIDRLAEVRPPVAVSGSNLLSPQVLLAACGGVPIILEKICEALRAGLPEQMRSVQDALRDGDSPRLREAAHKLCGMVAAFSEAAGSAASDLEDFAVQGDLEKATPLTARLTTMAEDLIRLVVGLSFDDLSEKAKLLHKPKA
jgi:hypothetical protein